jgi:hypothetical protein
MAEVMSNPSLGSVSSFTREYKTLTPNFDRKRNWEIQNPTFTDLLNESHGSKPLVVSKDDTYSHNEIVISQLEGIEAKM